MGRVGGFPEPERPKGVARKVLPARKNLPARARIRL